MTQKQVTYYNTIVSKVKLLRRTILQFRLIVKNLVVRNRITQKLYHEVMHIIKRKQNGN